MVEKQPEFVQSMITQLEQYPETVVKNFQSSLNSMISVLSDTQLEEWSKNGISLAENTVRSWDYVKNPQRWRLRILKQAQEL